MADVRALLRAERQSRKVTHPNATYTSDGKLLCNLCETRIKSESAWPIHLRSTQHTLRTDRAQQAAASRGAETSGRKRKAPDLDSPPPEERKKARATSVSDDAQEQREHGSAAGPVVPSEAEAVSATTVSPHDPEDDQPADPAVLEAFERELAELEAEMMAGAASTLAPTIRAAPMTAEQVAAQAREEQSAQRGKKDAEIEGEREDAARLLEDEFDEMEGLEERVKKLRQRREALRTGDTDGVRDSGAQPPEENLDVPATVPKNGGQVGEDEDDEEDEDEDFDDWTFGTS